jgi:hypothetical protein
MCRLYPFCGIVQSIFLLYVPCKPSKTQKIPIPRNTAPIEVFSGIYGGKLVFVANGGGIAAPQGLKPDTAGWTIWKNQKEQ